MAFVSRSKHGVVLLSFFVLFITAKAKHVGKPKHILLQRYEVLTQVPYLYDSEFGEFQEMKVSQDFRTSFRPEKLFSQQGKFEYGTYLNQFRKKVPNGHYNTRKLRRLSGRDTLMSRRKRKMHKHYFKTKKFLPERGEKEEKLRSPLDSLLNYFNEEAKVDNITQLIRDRQGKIMESYIDKSADPCNDFYQYACGNWESVHPIPGEKSVYDSFEIVRDSLDIKLRHLLEEPEEVGPRVSRSDILLHDAIRKSKAFYESCMNHDILAKRGNEPLLSLLAVLGGWPILQKTWDGRNFDWVKLAAQLRLYNNQILISQWLGSDIMNSDEYIIQFDQSNLGLQSKDYFLDPAHSRDLEAYRIFITSVAELLGAPKSQAVSDAKDIVNFEKKLATATTSPKSRYNITALYHKMPLIMLMKTVPGIDWQSYLNTVLAKPVNPLQTVIIYDIEYMQRLVQLMEGTPQRTTANYLLWRFVRHRINNLDDRFQNAKQQFLSVLFGREEIPQRWKTCVNYANDNMGMAVGAMYVRKNFDEKSKEDTLKMAEEIRSAFRHILNDNEWLDPETKRLAASKVDAMSLKIGYPGFILDPEKLNKRYERVTIHPERFFENMLSLLRSVSFEEFSKLGTRVNKSAWNVEPAIINAYYSRDRNQLIFPAGILQPPFYHRHFTRNLNYGGIGTVIGHEITHGFDDKGRLFDEEGNLHKWWRCESIKAFNNRAQCIIDQYSQYSLPEVSLKIDGVATQGENIADNGGIKQAYWAYDHWLKQHGDDGETLKHVPATPRQLFFLSFAQMWCGVSRPEMIRSNHKIAVHSPGRFRVIGSLSNSNEFSDVYNCPKGSPMNPVNKCEVW